MAIQAAGALPMINIVAEFGGTGTAAFSEYYRGGSLVADNAENAPIPTAGIIAMSDFFGTGAGVVPPSPPVTPPTNHTSSISPATVYGEGTRYGSPGNINATTYSTSISVLYGVGPFTYAWAYVSGTAATANSPTSGTTTFNRTAQTGTSFTTYTGVYRCTTTDTGNSNYTTTNDVTVETAHLYESE